MMKTKLHKFTLLALLPLCCLSAQSVYGENDSSECADFSQDVTKCLKTKIAADPKNAVLHYQLASEYFSYDKPKEGFEALNQAIKLDPENSEYYAALCNQLSAHNKPREALHAINQAIKFDPNKAGYWRDRGLIANWLNDPKTMEESYARAVELEPNNEKAVASLKQAREQVANLKNPTPPESDDSTTRDDIKKKNPTEGKISNVITPTIADTSTSDAPTKDLSHSADSSTATPPKAALPTAPSTTTASSTTDSTTTNSSTDDSSIDDSTTADSSTDDSTTDDSSPTTDSTIINSNTTPSTKTTITKTASTTTTSPKTASTKTAATKTTSTKTVSPKTYSPKTDSTTTPSPAAPSPTAELAKIHPKKPPSVQDKIKYLKQQGEFASWKNNLPKMENSYARILALQPNNADAILGMARACSWQGKLSCAITHYTCYLKIRPKSADALIELSDVYRQIESFRQSRSLLCTYRNYFGATKRYRAQLAKLFASAGWYNTATALNAPLLAKEPKNYDYLVTQFYAQHTAREYDCAANTLRKICRINPNGPETPYLNTILPMPTRTYVSLDEQVLHDSHTVEISETGLNGHYFFNTTTAIHFTALYEYAKATDINYTPVSGGDSIADTSGKLGIFHQFSPCLSAEANLGVLSIEDNLNFGIGNFNARWWPTENMALVYRFSHDLYRPNNLTISSPRSISLAILETNNFVHMHFEPALQFNIDSTGEYNRLSDGNNLWHFNIWPNTRLFSCPGLTMNVGVIADWYSFDRVLPNNGYYSPLLSQSYLGTLSFYHGFNMNNAISISGSLGLQKDETYPDFCLSSDINMDLVFGVFKNWQLDLIAGYSYRGSPTDAYDLWSARITLTRRL